MAGNYIPPQRINCKLCDLDFPVGGLVNHLGRKHRGVNVSKYNEFSSCYFCGRDIPTLLFDRHLYVKHKKTTIEAYHTILEFKEDRKSETSKVVAALSATRRT